MSMIRASARPRRVCVSPAQPTNDEAALLSAWDDDIRRAARAASKRTGLGAEHAFTEDLAQEARVALLLATRTTGVRHERYLRRVVRNALVNASRSTLVVANSVSDNVLEGEETKSRDVDVFARARVRGWVSRQPGQHRAVFHLLYREELTQREAARQLGLSQPRVAQLHRELLERGAEELQTLAA